MSWHFPFFKAGLKKINSSKEMLKGNVSASSSLFIITLLPVLLAITNTVRKIGHTYFVSIHTKIQPSSLSPANEVAGR